MTTGNNFTTCKTFFFHSSKWKICSELYLALKMCICYLDGGRKKKIPVLHICVHVYCKQPLLSLRYRKDYTVMFTMTLQQEIVISFDRKYICVDFSWIFFLFNALVTKKKNEIKGYLLFVRGGRYHNVIYSDICNKRI